MQTARDLNVISKVMELAYERTINTSSLQHRSLVRGTAEVVGLPSESLFFLFFGEVVFTNRRFVTELNKLIKAYPSDHRGDLKYFTDFYQRVLEHRSTRVDKGKRAVIPDTIFCSAFKNHTQRNPITSNDVMAARASCKLPYFSWPVLSGPLKLMTVLSYLSSTQNRRGRRQHCQ